MAQIIPDDTLGIESSIFMHGQGSDYIDGGAIRGTNLFHSFQNFNVKTGQQVYFVNPEGIETILSRITGSSVSDIDGLLGVDGTADLFLLNPNGVTFGPNAELDIRGAFTASTADTLEFADGSVFSAVEPQGNSLLTMSAPLGVQFDDQPRGDITNSGNLSVGREQALTLFGNTVLSSGSLVAMGGTVQLLGNRVGLMDRASINVSSSTGGGTILTGGNYQGQGNLPNAERVFVGSDVMLSADALQTGDGGRVIIWADEATYFTGSISAQGGPTKGNGGFIEVSGAESLTFAGEINTQALNGQAGQLLLDPTNIVIAETAPAGFVTVGPGNAVLTDFLYAEIEDIGQNSHLTLATLAALLAFNDLTLEATDTLLIIDNVDIFSNSDFILRAANIQVDNAFLTQSGGGDIVLDGSSIIVNEGSIITNVQVGSDLNAGDILISTQNLSIINSGVVGTFTAGNGNAGIVEITATENILLDGGDITSQVSPGGNGNSNGISINTNNLVVQNGGDLSASTAGAGNAGLVQINAAGDILVDGMGSSITSQVSPGGNGNSNGISITTNDLVVQNGGDLSASTAGAGNAGLMQINAAGNILVNDDNSSIFSQVESGAVGRSGGIFITTNDLIVENGGSVDVSTGSDGDSGPVQINATGDILVSGNRSFIASQVNQGSNSNSGDIVIATNNLLTLNGGRIVTSTVGQGKAGDIRLLAVSLVFQDAESGAFSFTNSFGRGGDIILNTSQIALENGAEIEAITVGPGNGGDITLNALNDLNVQGNGEITVASAGSGRAGNLEFNAGQTLNIDGIEVLAETQSSGLGGDIKVEVNEFNIVNGGRVSTSTTGSGQGGDLILENDGPLRIQGDSLITKAKGGNSGPAGDLNVIVPLLILDGVELSSASESIEGGGNIHLSVRDAVIMRRGSFINAESTNPNGGEGGNIVIDTFFLVAQPSENNDIVANAVGGDGGLVEINARQVRNFRKRRGFTTTRLRANRTNDLSANSEFGSSGQIIVDPSEDINELPADLEDLGNRITRGCGVEATASIDNQTSEFIITGRGGELISPTGIVNEDAPLDDLGPNIVQSDSSKPGIEGSLPTNQQSALLADSQTAVVTESGEVFLLAEDIWQASVSCTALR